MVVTLSPLPRLACCTYMYMLTHFTSYMLTGPADILSTRLLKDTIER
jgi:hypothetical protein